MAIAVKKLLSSLVLAPLGAPVLPAELAEPIDCDYQLALIEYYKFVPLKWTDAFQFIGTREQVIDHKTLLSRYINSVPTPTVKVDDFFYVGVLGFGALQQLGQARFDEFLLGQLLQRPGYDPLKYALYNTEIDINVGDPYYEEDFARGLTRFIVGGNCTLSVIYGFGTTEIDSTPLRHLNHVGELVKKTFYERIIAIRKTGKFNNADFQLDSSLLESAYKQALDNIKTFNIEAGLTAVSIG